VEKESQPPITFQQKRGRGLRLYAIKGVPGARGFLPILHVPSERRERSLHLFEDVVILEGQDGEGKKQRELSLESLNRNEETMVPVFLLL